MALMSTAAQSQALNALYNNTAGFVNYLGFVSLHTASPGTTGANEATGYTRQAATWTASSGGSALTNAAQLTFSLSPAQSITHTGSFTASTAGTFGIGTVLTSAVSAASIVFAAGSISYTTS